MIRSPQQRSSPRRQLSPVITAVSLECSILQSTVRCKDCRCVSNLSLQNWPLTQQVLRQAIQQDPKKGKEDPPPDVLPTTLPTFLRTRTLPISRAPILNLQLRSAILFLVSYILSLSCPTDKQAFCASHRSIVYRKECDG